jgi:adenylate cyclase
VRYHSQGYISLLQRNEALKKLEVRNRFIRETFGRYLSDDVVNNLLDAPEGLRLGGEKREVTIMMSDLRGFTAMSEVHDAELIVSMLNHYLGTMTDIIVRHGGTIDEFIGDGILVFFGAPQRRDDDAERAVACALEMQLAMTGINAWNAAHGLPTVDMGIGLNTGEVIVGNIGSQKRAKYGAVGSHVNLTGRVESYTVGGQILISETTRRALKTPLEIASEMRVEPKGVKAPISIFEVVGIGAPYNLRLAQDDASLVTLAAPLAVSFVSLDGKDATGEAVPGQLTRVSEREAELVTGRELMPMTNVRLRLTSHPAEDVYAKVLARAASTADAVVLRFTALPLSIASHFSVIAAR